MVDIQNKLGKFIINSQLYRIDFENQNLLLDAVEKRSKAYNVKGDYIGQCLSVKYSVFYRNRIHCLSTIYIHPGIKTITTDLEFHTYSDIDFNDKNLFSVFTSVINYFQKVDRHYGSKISALYVSAIIAKVIKPQSLLDFHKTIAQDCCSYINIKNIQNNIKVTLHTSINNDISMGKILCTIQKNQK
jgi:hypothetical protein